ncbi:MAG: GTP cyclohydrolase [Verrucomicrobiota bacterium]
MSKPPRPAARPASPRPVRPARSAPRSTARALSELLGRIGAGDILPEGRARLQARPLQGTSLFLASCALETVFGEFHVHVFQDLIHKGYILALTHGDLRAPRLYTRIHSSCVTSETLRGCDCDCVQQLEGALEVIARLGSGVLFDRMREGRGVGYVAKARDRMLEQASGDRVSTFQAYAAMGLRKDYRNYEDVAHVCQILGLARVRWILLTNNPDKVAAMRAAGLRVARAEPLEFEPSPFNLAYLSSKAASGHRLHRPGLTAVKSALPPEPVEPFAPHALAEAKRFVYVASYFLPMKPVDHEVLLTEAQYREHRALIEAHRAEEGGLVRDCYLIRDNRFILQFDPGKLRDLRQEHPRHPMVDLLTIPYWFRVHVYFDIVTSQEWVVLTHGRAKIYDLPVVRLHSESLFNRFPLTNMDNRDKFKRSVRHIVHYGVGAITLLYFDGRGAGFGAHATDRMLTEGAEALSSDEAYRKLGVGYDSRDYDACLTLLRRHLPTTKVQMIVNSPSSLVRKTEVAAALRRQQLEVEKWIFLDEHSVSD